jgi:hypothetical protein
VKIALFADSCVVSLFPYVVDGGGRTFLLLGKLIEPGAFWHEFTGRFIGDRTEIEKQVCDQFVSQTAQVFDSSDVMRGLQQIQNNSGGACHMIYALRLPSVKNDRPIGTVIEDALVGQMKSMNFYQRGGQPMTWQLFPVQPILQDAPAFERMQKAVSGQIFFSFDKQFLSTVKDVGPELKRVMRL